MKKNLTRRDFLRYSGAGLGTFGLLALTGCGSSSSSESTSSGSEEETTTTEETTTEETTEEVVSEEGTYVNGYEVAPTKVILDSYEYGTDYTSLYDQFGSDVTVDEVYEDPDTGYAYIERDGLYYELGLDFLTMAMVYNCDIPDGGTWESSDDVYATWWKLYIQRWNALLPEVPLYSNEYYDIYNTQITGVDEHQTNPYWSASDALIDWGSDKDDASIIIGNTTEVSGALRYYNYAGGGNAADAQINRLCSALYTVATTKEGGYQWDDNVVASHEETENADGSKTFTITIQDDLLFSDGSPITAKNYLVRMMVFSSPIAYNAVGSDRRYGLNFVGYDAFAAYDGTNEGNDATKVFSGVSLIDDYTFSVTVDASYLPYFYDVTYPRFVPDYLPMWIGDCDILDDGDGVYFSEDFYEKDGDNYVMAAQILAGGSNTDQTYPYSGPYCVETFDKSDSSATMVRNDYYKGNYEGTVPAIERVIYKRVISTTQLEDLKAGGIDVISGITGGDATNEAIALADESNGAYAYIHYSRAGYGKLSFRCDYGPVQFKEVRQAIAYCMDRASFAKDFTGGYGGVVDGPYYTGAWMYQAAVAQGMLLDSYATSADTAISVLEEGGWIYDKDGNEYTSGVRYKAIAADEISENDKVYQSKDGAYVTTQIGDYYYMPLALNWYGTTDNEFSDLLVTGFLEADNIATAGFVVQNTLGDFNPMLDERYQRAVYGYYSGTPMYCVFNFATSFSTAVYDYAYNMTIDPDLYDNYSSYYIKDEADAYWL